MEPDCHYQAQRPHKVGRTQGYALDLVCAQTTGRAEAGQGVCGIIRWSCAIRGHLQGWAGWAGWAPHIKGTGRARPLSSLLRGTCVKLSTCTCEVVSARGTFSHSQQGSLKKFSGTLKKFGVLLHPSTPPTPFYVFLSIFSTVESAGGIWVPPPSWGSAHTKDKGT